MSQKHNRCAGTYEIIVPNLGGHNRINRLWRSTRFSKTTKQVSHVFRDHQPSWAYQTLRYSFGISRNALSNECLTDICTCRAKELERHPNTRRRTVMDSPTWVSLTWASLRPQKPPKVVPHVRIHWVQDGSGTTSEIMVRSHLPPLVTFDTQTEDGEI